MEECAVIEKLKEKNFKNVISLGFFCSVARDMEKMGIRRCSGPFDWVWSTWTGVYSFMKNEFADFLLPENMAQSDFDRNVYADRKYGIIFFHDFTKYKRFEKQYPRVKSKYSRRIGYFYENIKEPTLFVRYIWNGTHKGVWVDEIQQIENDYQDFLKLIKKYNEKNEVIFIANEEFNSRILPIFYVKKDEGTVVNRRPLYANEYLKEYLENIDFADREKNIKIYREKERKSHGLWHRGLKKFRMIMSKTFLKEYIHENQYDNNEYRNT